MIDHVERFFTGLSDVDWLWYPFLHWRPPPHVRYDARFYRRIYSLGLLVVPIVIFLARTAPGLAGILTGAFHPTRAAVLAVLTDNVIPLFLPMVGLYVLLTLPSIWAWNRRADRLAQMPPEETPTVIEGVWPPPPRVPR